jgi:DNA-binding protein HU-beta
LLSSANQTARAQLVAALAERMRGDNKIASGLFDELSGILTETLAQGSAVTLPGLGKITSSEWPPSASGASSTGDQIK